MGFGLYRILKRLFCWGISGHKVVTVIHHFNGFTRSAESIICDKVISKPQRVLLLLTCAQSCVSRTAWAWLRSRGWDGSVRWWCSNRKRVLVCYDLREAEIPIWPQSVLVPPPAPIQLLMQYPGKDRSITEPRLTRWRKGLE